MSLMDVNEAASSVQMAAHPEAEIIFGAVIDEHMGEAMRVTVIATGYDDAGFRDVRPSAPIQMRRPEPERDSVGTLTPPEYEVHEKYNEEAMARWQSYAHAGVQGGDLSAASGPDDRHLEVPAFFRRRWARRR
jgi:cell division GTPase FtsZ